MKFSSVFRSSAVDSFPDVTNPNYFVIGHPDFHKKLEPGDAGYVPFCGMLPEADSITSLEDWNKLCFCDKQEVFKKKFPADYAEMPKMFRKYKEKAIAESKRYYYYEDWAGYMMQKYVETYLPTKSFPKIMASQVVKPLIREVKPLIVKSK